MYLKINTAVDSDLDFDNKLTFIYEDGVWYITLYSEWRGNFGSVTINAGNVIEVTNLSPEPLPEGAPLNFYLE